MSVSEGHEVYESSLIAGLRPSEAEDLSELDESTLVNEDISPSDIPALGAEIANYDANGESLPTNDIDEYVNQLLQNPEEIVPEWCIKGGEYPLENMASTLREKRDEYTLRTVYAFEDLLNQDTIDEAVGKIVNQNDYRHETPYDSADGNLSLVLGQYINEIQEVVEDESIISEAFNKISETNETCAIAAANLPIEQQPRNIQRNIFAEDGISSERVTTRLRKMQGSGKCSKSEKRNKEVLFGDNPSKNNTLITLNGELVGSLKYKGSNSMLALQDVTNDGRQVLQKGMTYRVSHPMIDEIGTERINEHQETYQDWEIKEPKILEVRPLRFAKHPENQSIQAFRNQIDNQIQQLEQQLEDIL